MNAPTNKEPALCACCGAPVPPREGVHLGGRSIVSMPTGKRRTFGWTWCRPCIDRTSPRTATPILEEVA